MSEVSRDLLSHLSSYSPPVDPGSSGSAPDKALPWGAILSLAGNILSSLWATHRNETLARQQNQWNIAQWQRENRYNLPSEQLQRLRDAGINPALAYANGGLMNEAASSPDLVSAMGHVTSPVQIDPLTAAQIRNLDAQTDKTDAETKTEEQLRQARYDQLMAAAKNLAEQDKEIAARIERYVHENGLTDAQKDKIKFDRMMEGKYYMLDKKRLQNETNLTNKQIEKLGADIQKTLAEKKVTEREYNEMIWTYAMRKSKLANEINLSAAQIAQAHATARKLGIEADLDNPEAIVARQKSSELESGAISTWAVMGLYDVLDNTAGSIFK